MRTATPVIREKTEGDTAACLDLLTRVHARDGYPLHLAPGDLPGFFRSAHERAAWVAEQDGVIVGHVALHCPPEDPTLTVAAEATGLPSARLALLARLFVAPELRRTGLGRALVRHATAQAPAWGRRAVLDVGQTLPSAIALYESEGWSRAGELHLHLDDFDPPINLDLWVYMSPAAA
ncbi:GNAT family N-acetyltransferase [Actinoplanes xinjiangensis]|uniref:GNAT family N-acetyltransferase n=1 Tax=Actinoplanes xinjiangensis TaxID=512350 RepID=UPI0034495728